MEEYLSLKWGTLKAWNLKSEKGRELLKRYFALGSSPGGDRTPRVSSGPAWAARNETPSSLECAGAFRYWRAGGQAASAANAQ